MFYHRTVWGPNGPEVIWWQLLWSWSNFKKCKTLTLGGGMKILDVKQLTILDSDSSGSSWPSVMHKQSSGWPGGRCCNRCDVDRDGDWWWWIAGKTTLRIKSNEGVNWWWWWLHRRELHLQHNNWDPRWKLLLCTRSKCQRIEVICRTIDHYG